MRLLRVFGRRNWRVQVPLLPPWDGAGHSSYMFRDMLKGLGLQFFTGDLIVFLFPLAEQLRALRGHPSNRGSISPFLAMAQRQPPEQQGSVRQRLSQQALDSSIAVRRVLRVNSMF